MDDSAKEIQLFDAKPLKVRTRHHQSFALRPVLFDPLHEFHGGGRGLAHGPRHGRSRRHRDFSLFRLINRDVAEEVRVCEGGGGGGGVGGEE